MDRDTAGHALPKAVDCHLVHARAQAATARAAELRQQTEQVLAKTQILMDAWRERWSSPARDTLPPRPEYVRLLGRLETMSVIERAKGIIMAQSRCGEAEALDTLRRASRRSGLPIRDLAARIVAKAAATATEPDRQGRTPTPARTKLLRAG